MFWEKVLVLERWDTPILLANQLNVWGLVCGMLGSWHGQALGHRNVILMEAAI